MTPIERKLQWMVALAVCGLACQALAQSAFPAKPLRFIAIGTGFPENNARVIGNEITAMAGQSGISHR